MISDVIPEMILRAVRRRDMCGWRLDGPTDGGDIVFALDIGRGSVLTAWIDGDDPFAHAELGLRMEDGFVFEAHGLTEVIGFDAVIDLRQGDTQIHLPYDGPIPRDRAVEILSAPPAGALFEPEEWDAPIWWDGGDGHPELRSDPPDIGAWDGEGLEKLAVLALLNRRGPEDWVRLTDHLSMKRSERGGRRTLNVWLSLGDDVGFSFDGEPMPAEGGVAVIGESAGILIPIDRAVMDYAHWGPVPGKGARDLPPIEPAGAFPEDFEPLDTDNEEAFDEISEHLIRGPFP